MTEALTDDDLRVIRDRANGLLPMFEQMGPAMAEIEIRGDWMHAPTVNMVIAAVRDVPRLLSEIERLRELGGDDRG